MFHAQQTQGPALTHARQAARGDWFLFMQPTAPPLKFHTTHSPTKHFCMRLYPELSGQDSDKNIYKEKYVEAPSSNCFYRTRKKPDDHH